MNNQARASRHASGILPSKQFFAPRKPITHSASLRKKPSLSVVGNSSSTPPSPGSTLTSAIGSQLLSNSSVEEVSLLHQPSSLALANFASHSSINSPSLDQSIDTIFNSDASVVNRNSAPVRPPSALLLRRQQRQQNGEGGSTELSQAVIDSVMEPTTPAPVLEPSSYRQLMRQATINAGSDLSSKDFAAATAYSMHSDVSPSSNTKLTMISSKKSNPSSPTKQSTFNSYALIKMPRIISPHSLSSTGSKGQKRLYQVWPGRNRFFLGGRIMTSRDFPAFLVAFSALVVPSGLFMGFTCPFLFKNLSPAVVFIFVYLFLLAVTSMLRTSWSDPGIIPRDLDPSPPTENTEGQENSQSNTNIAYDQARSFPLPREVKINGQTVRLKYCDTCKIYRPPRCSHCRTCDNCVENEDHHCIWLNNCVGRRNYRTFFTFIATATVLCIYVLGFSLAHLLLLMKHDPRGFFGAIMTAPVSFLLIVLSFFLMWSVGGLTGYHMYLISNNLTTHEQIRVPMARRNGNRNPFDLRNACKNCLWVLCRPMSRSSVSRRAYVGNENLQEEINGASNNFNEGVRSTVVAGDVDMGEIDNNVLGEGDIRVDIKEVITFNNGNDLNEPQPQQNGNKNIKEDTEQVSSSSEPPIDENISDKKEQTKELHTTESTESNDQNETIST